MSCIDADAARNARNRSHWSGVKWMIVVSNGIDVARPTIRAGKSASGRLPPWRQTCSSKPIAFDAHRLVASEPGHPRTNART